MRSSRPLAGQEPGCSTSSARRAPTRGALTLGAAAVTMTLALASCGLSGPSIVIVVANSDAETRLVSPGDGRASGAAWVIPSASRVHVVIHDPEPRVWTVRNSDCAALYVGPIVDDLHPQRAVTGAVVEEGALTAIPAADLEPFVQVPASMVDC